MSDAAALLLYPRFVPAEPRSPFPRSTSHGRACCLCLEDQVKLGLSESHRPRRWLRRHVRSLRVQFGLGQCPLPCRSFPDLTPRINKPPCNSQEAAGLDAQSIKINENFSTNQTCAEKWSMKRVKMKLNHCNINILQLVCS